MYTRIRFILLIANLFWLTACSKDHVPSISIQPNVISVPAEGGNVSVQIHSNTTWTLSDIPDYIHPSSMSGKGDHEITFRVGNHVSHQTRNANITITATDVTTPLVFSIQQQPYAGNTPPSQPVLIAPVHMSTDVDPIVVFSWEPCSDVNDDEVTYLLYYRQQGRNFDVVVCGPNTHISIARPLIKESVYEWYVVALDGYDFVQSEVFQFSTSSTYYYSEEEVRPLLLNRPVHGVNLVFLCDGFIVDDLKKGGACDQAVEEALGHFFDIEPYRSYKEFFNAYVVYSFSAERGASYGAENTLKNTSFQVTCDKNSRTSTAMSSDSGKVFRYAKKAPIGPINETLIIVISQDTRYAGTCYFWGSTDDWGGGKAIALTTMSKNSYPYDFRGTVQHEAGGHGFAKLADEYIDDRTAQSSNRNDVANRYTYYGHYANVDTTSNLTTIRWKEFIGLPRYESVNAFEGGYYFSTGVWRPEVTSCMINNIAYYNAPSRCAIVKRIKKIAREEFLFEEFLAKDVDTKPVFATLPPVKSQEQLYLAPPVFIKE